MTRPENVGELDDIWRKALRGIDAPAAIVELDKKLQKAAQDLMDAEDELRDWARKQKASLR